jgi:hypothetical protein
LLSGYFLKPLSAMPGANEVKNRFLVSVQILLQHDLYRSADTEFVWPRWLFG